MSKTRRIILTFLNDTLVEEQRWEKELYAIPLSGSQNLLFKSRKKHTQIRNKLINSCVRKLKANEKALQKKTCKTSR